MDRFYEESAADLVGRYNRHAYGYADLSDEDIVRCEDCEQPCNHRIYNSEFHARVCPKCNELMKEAVRQEALEEACPARHDLAMTGPESVHALAELLRAHEAVCAICGSNAKTVQSDRIHLDPKALCCEGKAA